MIYLRKSTGLLGLALGILPALLHAESTLLWRQQATGQHHSYIFNQNGIADSQPLGSAVEQSWQTAGYADFDNNGTADVLLRHATSGKNYIYFNQGTKRQLSKHFSTIVDTNWQVAGTGDFNGDGFADIVWRNQVTGANHIYLMQNDTILKSQGLSNAALTWQLVAVADFDGDGKDDLLWRNSNSGENYINLLDGVQIKQSAQLSQVGFDWYDPIAADVDGDAKDDLIWRHRITGDNYVYFMNGLKTRTNGIVRINRVADSNWRLAGAADVNGDGKDDLIWRHQVLGLNAFYQMDGASVAKLAVLNSVPTGWEIAGVADYDSKVVPVELSSLSLSQGDLSLLEGASVQLQVTGHYSDDTNKDLTALVTWHSDEDLVAQVSAGQVTALQQGTAVISATMDDVSVSLNVTVEPQQQGLYVYFKKPSDWSAEVKIYSWAGGSADFGEWAGAQMMPYSGDWYRQELTEAHLNSSGCMNVIFSDGAAQSDDLSFCDDEGSARYDLEQGWQVGKPDISTGTLTSIQFQSPLTQLTAGQTGNLILMGQYSDNTAGPVIADSWSSSDSSVVSVTQGTVKALKAGTATITARKGDYTATQSIKVLEGSADVALYFKKPDNWDNVYAHIWTVDSAGNLEANPTGDWPGLQLNEIDENYYAVSVLPEYISADGSVHVIFNDGAGQQTDDLSVSGDSNAYYQDGQWQDGNPVTPKVQITFNGTSAPSGKYEIGHVLSISADQPLPGMSFVRWSVSGDRVNVLADSLSATTQLTVPSDIDSLNVTAVYGDEYSLGRDYYSQGQCAVCHGVDGQGQFPLLNLQARYTEASLTQKIAATMPTTNPKSCEGDCASEIAHMLLAEAFTFALDCSDGLIPPDRQIRLLTEREYRNTIQDLLGVSVGDIALPTKVGFEGSSKGGSDTNAALKLADTDAEVYLNAAYQLAEKTALSTVAARFASCGSDIDCQINAVAERAYRRLLTSAERADLKAVYNELGDKAALVAILSAPSFLYRSEQGQLVNASQLTGVLTESGYQYYQLSDFEIATLLSYSYWASMPDNDLFNKAKNNQLHTAAQIKAAIESMLSDSRAKAEYGEFVTGWLHVNNVSSKGHVRELGKDFLTETQLFAQDVAFNQSGHYGDLLTAPYTYLNKNLSENYGFGAVSSSSFQKVTISQPQRQGLIGQGSVLAQFSMGVEEPNIITRGLFVRERLLCQSLGTPPANAGMLPNMDEVSSTRQRFNLHGTVEGCASCHQYIDGVGFGTENFNGLGQFRLTENFRGQNIVALTGAGDIANIESVGTPSSGSGLKTDFNYVTGLSELIADSTNAKSCYVRQYYRHMRGAMEHDSTQNMQDSCTLQTISQDFAKGSLTLKQQMSKMADHAVFAIRKYRQ